MVKVDGFYSWDWQWSSQDNTLVNIVGANTNFSGIFKSNNKNGNTTVTIKAKKKTPAVGYAGEDITDEANISLFMCTNPWTFEDYGFRLRYCMDGGLPELEDGHDAVVTTTQTPGSGLIREYIFKYKEASPVAYSSSDSKSKKGFLSIATDNRLGAKMFAQVFGSIFNNFVSRVLAQNLSYQDDLIGIRVYTNDDHLSPRDWYRKTNEFDFKGSPQAKKVGFYDGLIDGRTTYINAGKKSINTNGQINIRTEIYLISKNQDSSPFTNNIYSQLLDGWKFNAQETSVDQEKIAQDVKRWQDLRTIENSLESYANSNKFCAKELDITTCPTCADGNLNCDNSIIRIGGACFSVSNVSCTSDSDCISSQLSFDKCLRTYPELTSGTYIRGLTNSLWGSWDSNLGAALKTTLPKDPENKFGNCQVNCPTCDETTCFDDRNKIFNCPTGSKVYYYKVGTYQSGAKKSLNYSIYSLFNYPEKSMWSGNNEAKLGNNKIEISNEGVCSGDSETDNNY